MATLTTPFILLSNLKVLKNLQGAVNEGKFLPGYWINHLPPSELKNVRLYQDGNLVKAEITVEYETTEDAVDAHKKILDHINYGHEIFSKANRERKLVYFTYNFIKL